MIDLVMSSLRNTFARVGIAISTGLLVAAAALSISNAPAQAATLTSHAGTSCAQATPFPYGSAVVGMAATPDDGGYWIVTNDGYVAACGDAALLGEQTSLNAPIVGIAATPDGGGYYLVASDGGIFAFGDAEFQGSAGSLHLNKVVVGMTVDPTTGGYWLVATDGGIFAYGVPFFGSTGSIHLNRPVVGMAADAATGGYWLVASDGGIFSYNAPFYGSTGSMTLDKPIVGMESPTSGSGYRFIAADGGVFTYGTSGFYSTPIFAPPPPSSPSPGGSPNAPACLIYMSNSSPPDGYEETATITSNQPNASVTLSKHYSTTTSTNSGITDGTGEAAISFNIGSAAQGYPVVVYATVGAASCSTGFTPV
ncbi:MAG TPA: hypothetical protein VH012_07640 [Acidimicrobiales bacterium]|nr:hypothetical protein [Acidimicrobiales bacterium]